MVWLLWSDGWLGLVGLLGRLVHFISLGWLAAWLDLASLLGWLAWFSWLGWLEGLVWLVCLAWFDCFGFPRLDQQVNKIKSFSGLLVV